MRGLDLFCGGGGGAWGIHLALPDAEIVGVDNRNQPHYPFTFVLADALTYPLDGFDFVWASPVCKAYSQLTEKKYRGNHPMQIAALHERLKASGIPYVIENVKGARYHLDNPVMLCGSMFNLKVWRHRYFETYPVISSLLPPCDHSFVPVLISGSPRRNGSRKEPSTQARREAMGTPWMTRAEMDEAIPPAYSEWLIRQIFGTSHVPPWGPDGGPR